MLYFVVKGIDPREIFASSLDAEINIFSGPVIKADIHGPGLVKSCFQANTVVHRATEQCKQIQTNRNNSLFSKNYERQREREREREKNIISIWCFNLRFNCDQLYY